MAMSELARESRGALVASVVTLRNLSKRFGAKAALDDVSAQIEPGDVIGVLGKNGAGKTTLLEVLLGFSPPSSGSSEVFGENSLELSERTKARIGFVPQQDELLPMLTGKGQLSVTAAFHAHWDHALIQRLVSEWEVPTDRWIHSLSVGERQKLSVLTALGHHPDLLVLDEPVASLDPIARRRFLQQLLDVAEDQARAVLFSSHIVSDLERAANKVWIVEDGRLSWHGEVDALKESVVRLHVHAKKPLPADLTIDHALTCRIEGERATLAVAQWNPAKREELASRLGASIEVEPLGLEDIFIELHQ
jgi:ABC-2 type transport system ATP-binding protein